MLAVGGADFEHLNQGRHAKIDSLFSVRHQRKKTIINESPDFSQRESMCLKTRSPTILNQILKLSALTIFSSSAESQILEDKPR